MAHVTVELRFSPEGLAEARLMPRGTDVGSGLPDFGDVSFPLLRLIDPYGDTIFNAYQMAGLIPELLRLATREPDPVLRQLVDLADACRRTPHSYLVFIGD